MPARWGWQAADRPVPVASPTPELVPMDRPAWIEPPRPDTGHLRQARSAAVTKLTWRLALSTLVVVAFLAFRELLEQEVRGLGESAAGVFQVAVLLGGAVMGLGVIWA